MVGANLRQVASSPPQPVKSAPTSGSLGGSRSWASFAPRGLFISSIGHSMTLPVTRCGSTLCRSSRNMKYVLSAWNRAGRSRPDRPAAWHQHFEFLYDALDGSPRGWSDPSSERRRELRVDYESVCVRQA